MGKNHKLLNTLNDLARKKQEENIGKAADEMVPQIYAAIAIALHRKCGFGYKRINDVFVESQNIWEGFAGKPDDMIALCEKETGVTVTGKEPEDNE